MFSLPLVALAGAIAPLVAAHPHAMTPQEAAFHENSRRSLDACQGELQKRGHIQRSAERRRNLAEKIRKERGLAHDRPFLQARDSGSVLNTSHLSTATGYGAYANPAVVFANNSTCTVGPETTEGPYYVAGEYVRYDVTEDQAGVPLYLDIELIDTNDCSHVSDIPVEIWGSNSTGVYAGVSASGNGDGDEANLNTTFLRGVQVTTDEGYAQFLTLLPGHYTGRTNHIHIAAHVSDNGTWFANGTFGGLAVSHIGQLFFDQDLVDQVETVAPYTTNTQNITTNEEDGILLQEADVIDPIVEYVLIGDSVSDGILAWSSIAIDTTASYAISAAATLTDAGGVANPNAGGGGGPPPNTTSSASV